MLFGDVELQAGDDAEGLRALGLTIERKARALRFSQPCSCLDGGLCRIYEERPAQCRTFECALVQRVNSGTVGIDAALKAIRHARREVGTVRELLQKLGQRDEHLPLSRRCAKVISQPIDLTATEGEIELRGELLLAISKLTNILQREFLERSGKSS